MEKDLKVSFYLKKNETGLEKIGGHTHSLICSLID